MASAAPSNMQLVSLPVAGLANLEANALVAWHPSVSLELPLLVVLFFHGLEPDPQNPDSQKAQDFAWTSHRLPDQLATCGKNAVLIAPTMQFSGGGIVTDYVATQARIATLVQEGLAAIGRSLGRPDGWPVEPLARQAKLLLVGFSNGYLAWSRAVRALLSGAPPPGSEPPSVIGHTLFDCLYWGTPLMDGVDRDAPPAAARFSTIGRAIAESSFVTTHFSSKNPTLVQADYLTAMVGNDATLSLHAEIPVPLRPRDIVKILLPTADHLAAVSSRRDVSRVIAAVSDFDLPASPSV